MLPPEKTSCQGSFFSLGVGQATGGRATGQFSQCHTVPRNSQRPVLFEDLGNVLSAAYFEAGEEIDGLVTHGNNHQVLENFVEKHLPGARAHEIMVLAAKAKVITTPNTRPA